MKKIILLAFAFLLLLLNTKAQKKSSSEKVVEASEKVNKKSQQISDASNKVKNEAGQVAANAKNVLDNVKAIIRVFDPVWRFHFKKKLQHNSNDQVVYNKPTEITGSASNSQGSSSITANNVPANDNGNTTMAAQDMGAPENENYNPDMSVNLGNQHHALYSNFLDVFRAQPLDLDEAESNPDAIDLVYLADQYGGYVLTTPVFLKNSDVGFHYENPVKGWSNVNESEIALTKLTIAQFESIPTDKPGRFYSLVKQASGFSSHYQSFDQKLNGKVFAIRSEMSGKKTYALVAVVDHIGTFGSSGYLKIKIRATGIDGNGDGNVDESANIR